VNGFKVQGLNGSGVQGFSLHGARVCDWVWAVLGFVFGCVVSRV